MDILDPATMWRHAHDTRAVERTARRLAKAMGLRCATWHREEKDRWLVLRSPRHKGEHRPRVYLSAGIHGDEAASVWGALAWLAEASDWLEKIDLTLIPCLNPWGLRHNTRTDAVGRDLNRYYNRSRVVMIAAHRALMQAHGPFDLALTLHEDYDAAGFYLYEVSGQRERWGERILLDVAQVCPVDLRAKIEGRRAQRGVIARNLRGKRWRSFFQKFGLPEAVHLAIQGTARVYTLESPSELAFSQRVEAHQLAVKASVGCLMGNRSTVPPRA